MCDIDKRKWFFFGADGCDKCQDATGWYEEKPVSHPNCDCEIEDLSGSAEDDGVTEDLETDVESSEIDPILYVRHDNNNKSATASYTFDSADYKDLIDSELLIDDNDVRTYNHETFDFNDELKLEENESIEPDLTFTIFIDEHITYDSPDKIKVIEDTVNITVMESFDWGVTSAV